MFDEPQLRHARIGSKIHISIPSIAQRSGIVKRVNRYRNITIIQGTLLAVPGGRWTATVFPADIDLQILAQHRSFDVSRGRHGEYVARETTGLRQLDDRPKWRGAPRRRRSHVMAAPTQHNTITVLVLYTSGALSNFRNDATDANAELQIRQHINNAVEYTNVAFANTELHTTLQPIVQKTAFIESSSLNSDLDTVADQRNERGAVVRNARDAAKADLVMVIRDVAATDGAGLSWELSSVDRRDQNYNKAHAFSEIRADCIDQWYHCFAHELGHALGAGHDTAAGDNFRMYSDGYGYSFTVNGDCYADLMAYDCADNRMPFYSNPDVTYLRHAFGTIGANNAHAMRDAADYVSKYWQ